MSTIDYAAVRRYFDRAGAETSSAASYMAHDDDLPSDAFRYRFEAELETIEDWLKNVPLTGRVLDVGCGSGTWTEYFSHSYSQVVGVEGSSAMVKAAMKRTGGLRNVEVRHADAREALPEGEFELVFLGGLCMYLNDIDLIDLLSRIRERLAPNGTIILRESTVPDVARGAEGDYDALYRTTEDYQRLFAKVGFSSTQVRRNFGYTAMETAIELVHARRRYLRFLPQRSVRLGAITWWLLRATAPIAFKAVPKALQRLDVTWPALQNHFFRLKG